MSAKACQWTFLVVLLIALLAALTQLEMSTTY